MQVGGCPFNQSRSIRSILPFAIFIKETIKVARLVLTILMCGLMASTFADQTAQDPEAWYRDGYGPLWEEDPSGRVQQMIGYYADAVKAHWADGEIALVQAQDLVAEPIKGWLAEGWLSSKLKDLQVDRINPSTISFKASWIDRYQDDPDELSCGWYLADLVDGKWKFTAYADLDCAAHGFHLTESG